MNPLPQRPAENFDALKTQLQGALEKLQQGDADAAEFWRAYLRQLMALTWQRLSRGDLSAPHKALQTLESSQPFVEAHLPEQEDPKQEAARELHFAWATLEMAGRAAEATGFETDLDNRQRSELEWEVLRILSESSGTFLRRGEILERIQPAERRPTPARISQFLNRLYEQGLLLRTLRKARGATEVGFYALSETGQDFCREHLAKIEDGARERSNLKRRPLKPQWKKAAQGAQKR